MTVLGLTAQKSVGGNRPATPLPCASPAWGPGATGALKHRHLLLRTLYCVLDNMDTSSTHSRPPYSWVPPNLELSHEAPTAMALFFQWLRRFGGCLFSAITLPFACLGCGPVVVVPQGHQAAVLVFGKFSHLVPPGTYHQNIGSEDYFVKSTQVWFRGCTVFVARGIWANMGLSARPMILLMVFALGIFSSPPPPPPNELGPGFRYQITAGHAERHV